MEKSVREKTSPVPSSREASTVEAIKAALVLKLAGIFLTPDPMDVSAGVL